MQNQQPPQGARLPLSTQVASLPSPVVSAIPTTSLPATHTGVLPAASLPSPQLPAASQFTNMVVETQLPLVPIPAITPGREKHKVDGSDAAVQTPAKKAKHSHSSSAASTVVHTEEKAPVRSSSSIFDVIVVTAASTRQADSFRNELALRRQSHTLPPIIPNSTHVVVLSDPDDVRVGSGGATLNALVEAVKVLHKEFGGTLDGSLMKNRTILVLHSGGDSKRVPICSVRGKAFCELPTTRDRGDRLYAPFDFLLESLTRIFSNCPSGGVIVASTDVLLHLPDDEQYDWYADGVTGVAIPMHVSYGVRHGVYCLDQSNQVTDFIQKGSNELLHQKGAVTEDEAVLLDTGIIYFSPTIAADFLRASAALGGVNMKDKINIHWRFELYSDVLLAMNKNMSYDEYLVLPYESTGDRATVLHTRRILWTIFRPYNFRALPIHSGEFAHLGTLEEYLEVATKDSPFREPYDFTRRARCKVAERVQLEDSSVIINSILDGDGTIGDCAFVEHCSDFSGRWSIGSHSICSSVRNSNDLYLLSFMVLQHVELPIGAVCDEEGMFVLTLVGLGDPIKEYYKNAKATYLNEPWEAFLSRFGIRPKDLWPRRLVDDGDRSIWSAKLFPIQRRGEEGPNVLWMQHPCRPPGDTIQTWRNSTRLSLEDILRICEPNIELAYRRSVALEIDLHRIRDVIANGENVSVMDIIKQYFLDVESGMKLLSQLEEMLNESSNQMEDLNNLQSLRIICTIADVLEILKNQDSIFTSSTTPIQLAPKVATIYNMTRFNNDWLEDSTHLEFSRQYYVSLVKETVRKCVSTVVVSYSESSKTQMNHWVCVESPARIDIAGGWSDTPPLCYEHGGCVVNMAVKVDGELPIGARARRIQKPHLIFRDGQSETVMQTTSDLTRYNNVETPNALLQCVVIAMKIVSLTSNVPLSQQLYEGGLEVEVWSKLPQGSGLGTSSIIAACAVTAVASVLGRKYTLDAIIHITLVVEQLMTTGGGYQDQVGGIYGGFKISSTEKGLPLSVQTRLISGLPDSFFNLFNDHCILVYTGIQRLAKNLLDSVIFGWYHRDEHILNTFDELCTNAEKMQRALRQGSIEDVAKYLNRYWRQKRRLAKGAEPPGVKKIIQKIRPYALGISLVGAGGGGFMLVITKEPKSVSLPKLQAILSKEIAAEGTSLHQMEVDLSGMRMTIVDDSDVKDIDLDEPGVKMLDVNVVGTSTTEKMELETMMNTSVSTNSGPAASDVLQVPVTGLGVNVSGPGISGTNSGANVGES